MVLFVMESLLFDFFSQQHTDRGGIVVDLADSAPAWKIIQEAFNFSPFQV